MRTLTPRPGILIPSVLAGLLFLGTSVQAQESSGVTGLELTVTRQLPFQPPLPSAGALQKDVEEAIAAMAARGRNEAGIREALRALGRFPGLDRDVVQGVHAGGIQDALRRRQFQSGKGR